MAGRVREEDPRPLNVRSGAGVRFPRIGQLVTGSTFLVMEGPVCSGNFAWYRIQYGGGLEGWIAEGDDFYFVEPIALDEHNAGPLAQGALLMPTCERVLVEDNFEDNFTENDWFEGGSTRSTVAILDNAYNIRIASTTEVVDDHLTSWGSLRGFEFGDGAIIEAVMRADQFTNADVFMGLWVHYQDENNFLSFGIRGDGRYRIARFDGEYTFPVNWTPARAINTNDDGVNTLRVDIAGNRFDFYINGLYVDSINDRTWDEGRVAFFGSTRITPLDFNMDFFRVCEN